MKSDNVTKEQQIAKKPLPYGFGEFWMSNDTRAIPTLASMLNPLFNKGLCGSGVKVSPDSSPN